MHVTTRYVLYRFVPSSIVRRETRLSNFFKLKHHVFQLVTFSSIVNLPKNSVSVIFLSLFTTFSVYGFLGFWIPLFVRQIFGIVFSYGDRELKKQLRRRRRQHRFKKNEFLSHLLFFITVKAIAKLNLGQRNKS